MRKALREEAAKRTRALAVQLRRTKAIRLPRTAPLPKLKRAVRRQEKRLAGTPEWKVVEQKAAIALRRAQERVAAKSEYQIRFYEKGKGKTRLHLDYTAARNTGTYFARGVNQFAETRDEAILRAFDGMGVYDTAGNFREFETDPQVVAALIAQEKPGTFRAEYKRQRRRAM
jgi:hypothetical protein